jgi:hypothetical protein
MDFIDTNAGILAVIQSKNRFRDKLSYHWLQQY